MTGAKVKPSRESERKYLIGQLNAAGIYETLKGRPLEEESYHNLRARLAVARAVAQ